MNKLSALSLTMGLASIVMGNAWAATQAPSPQALWQQIETLQKTHAILPESHPLQVGSRMVDPYTTDLANSAAIHTIQTAGGITKVTRYENGSLLVKENYNKDRKLDGVTAMLKLKGYDAGDRNWVMAAYQPDGSVTAFGKVGSCIACHVLVQKQDFGFAPPPKQLLPIHTWKAFFPKQAMNPKYVALLQSHPKAIVP